MITRRALAAIFTIALLSTVFLDASALPARVLCPTQLLFHLPCPGCGLTRALFAIGHGRFLEAWTLNPFGYVFELLALLGIALGLTREVRWAEPLRRQAPRSAALLLVAMFSWNLLRIWSGA